MPTRHDGQARHVLMVLPLLALIAGCQADREAPIARTPVLVGEPWQIAGNPDLGELTGEKQQPVDFSIWQAADGTWQLWSCIRGTKCGGKTRLLYRWEGRQLTDRDWKPMGIAMQADERYGETPGGLQAPHVFERFVPNERPDWLGRVTYERRWMMAYGDWVNICFAESYDGKTFERTLVGGKAGRFSEGVHAITRDPMVLRVGDTWYCYYTAGPGRVGADYCRTSKDLATWSASTVVARGGRTGSGPWSAECPFVVHLDGYFYLFRTQKYAPEPQTSVYRSRDPLNFGVDTDEFFITELPVAAPEVFEHEGQWYLACLLPDLKGIRVFRLEWREAERMRNDEIRMTNQ